MSERNIARADSKDAEPSARDEFEGSGLQDVDQRSASAVRPSSAKIQPASTASGVRLIAASPIVASHRCTVEIWPARYVGRISAVIS